MINLGKEMKVKDTGNELRGRKEGEDMPKKEIKTKRDVICFN